MSDTTNGDYGFAIVEIYGHQKIAGYCREVEQFGTVMLRVDVPATARTPAFTKDFGGNAVFSITPVDENVMRSAAEQLAQSGYVRRLQWHMAQLPETVSHDDGDWEEADLDEPPLHEQDTTELPIVAWGSMEPEGSADDGDDIPFNL